MRSGWMNRLMAGVGLLGFLVMTAMPADGGSQLPAASPKLGGAAKKSVLDKAEGGGLLKKGATMDPTKPQATAEPTKGHQVDLSYVKCRKIWFHGIGERDLVILELMAYDPASDKEAQYVAVTFKCRTGKIYPLHLTRLFGPQAVKNQLRLVGSFTVAHPQNFKNVRNAMHQYAEARGALVKIIGEASGDPIVAMVAKGSTTAEMNKIRGDFLTEVIKVGGRILCGGNNPLRRTKNIDVTLTPQLLKQHENQEYKFWYIAEGAKAKNCFREIKYDLVSRVLFTDIPKESPPSAGGLKATDLKKGGLSLGRGLPGAGKGGKAPSDSGGMDTGSSMDTGAGGEDLEWDEEYDEEYYDEGWYDEGEEMETSFEEEEPRADLEDIRSRIPGMSSSEESQDFGEGEQSLQGEESSYDKLRDLMR